MTKPIGPICNLDCTYCYYLEKETLFAKNEKFRMADEVLETYIRKYIQAQPPSMSEVAFAWQGGEPTLLGLDYFKRVVELQAKHNDGRKITNALQTNGTLLDDDWCLFFKEHNFLIGISIDGPKELHDHYRVDKRNRSSFEEVIRGLELLKKHGTQFNTLTTVNRINSAHPLKVYHFLKEIGSRYPQFIPIVERKPNQETRNSGFDFALPPNPDKTIDNLPVTSESVIAEVYGQFLCTIFDEWVRHDVGTVFIQLFEDALSKWMGYGSSMCIFAPTCGSAMALEHDGKLYSCDHYVYPEYEIGNIMDSNIADLLESPAQKKFGQDKHDTLPEYCRSCDYLFACHGECPKHRFIKTPSGEAGLNYLCPAYKHFYAHIDPYMQTMVKLLHSKQPPPTIMKIIAEKEAAEALQQAGRNDPCPCGSGKKHKRCCG